MLELYECRILRKNQEENRQEALEVKSFEEFLQSIEEPVKKNRLTEIFSNISDKFPELKEEIKWNQPMYTHHGTFIIGFSVAKHHIAIAPEAEALEHFAKAIKKSGYQRTKMLFRIQWHQDVDYELLEEMIAYNITEKRETTKFWR